MYGPKASSDSSSPSCAQDFDSQSHDNEEWKTLQDDIAPHLRYYCDRTDEPPFTPEEMIIIAMIHLDYIATEADILHWIFSKFKYYNKSIVAHYVTEAALLPQKLLSEESWEDDSREFEYIRRSWERREPPGLLEIQEPFKLALRNQGLPVRTYYGNGLEVEYEVEAGHARAYLARWLQKPINPRKTSFRFLDLPAELRTRIYELLLVFPNPGLLTSRCKTDPMSKKKILCFAARRGADDEDELEVPDAQSYADGDFYRVPLDKTLAIAKTCRKIRSEASSVFYGLNHFSFDDLHSMHRVLYHLDPKLIKMLKYVTVNLKSHPETRVSGLKALKAPFYPLRVASLEKLTFVVDPKSNTFCLVRDSLPSPEFGRCNDYGNKIGIQHMVVAAARAETISFRGYYHGLQEFVREGVERLNEKEDEDTEDMEIEVDDKEQEGLGYDDVESESELGSEYDLSMDPGEEE